MEAQTVVTLEGRATKNFTIATVTLLLAFFTLLLITHTDRTLQPAWLVLLLWLEFAVSIVFSGWCLVRSIKLLKQAKQIGNYRDTNFGFNTRGTRTLSFINFSFCFSVMLPFNVFNQPDIQDAWLLNMLYFHMGIIAVSAIIGIFGFIDFPIIKNTKRQLSAPLLDKKTSVTTSIISIVISLVQSVSQLIPFITWAVFSYNHNARYWFLDTDTTYFSLLLGLAILGIQALISSEIINRFRAKAALQH